MPNLQYILDVILNDTGAKKDITAIEAELKKLKDFGETGIRVVLDKDGNAVRVLSELKDKTGAIVAYTREWDEKTKSLVQTSAVLSVNYEKARKEKEKAAEADRKAEQEARRLLAQEEELARKAEERAKREREIADSKARQAEHDRRQSELNKVFANWKDWRADESYTSRLSRSFVDAQIPVQQYIDKLTGVEREQSKINATTSVFASMSDRAYSNYLANNGLSFATNNESYVNRLSRSFVDAQMPVQQFIDKLTGVEREQSRINAETSVFATMSDRAFREYMNGTFGATSATQELSASEENAANNQRVLGEETERTGERAEKSAKAFTLLHTVFLRLAHRAISLVTRAFREAFTEMKNVDSELVVVRKVSDATAEELAVLKDRAYEVGAAYGVLASDYLNAAAEMTRAGYREQAGDLAELATKLQLVGDVSQDVANQFLIAVDKSYKMNGNFEKLSLTIDKLNEIDNNFATSFEKVADGIGLLAPVAAQANVSFDEMAAAIGTVTAVTQRSGTEAARALRSLFINILKDTTTEIEDGVTWTVDEINSLSDALKKYAPEVVRAAEASGDLINPMEALAALSQAYKDNLLTNQDLFEITSGLGGKLRTSQLLALIQNWDMYNQMLERTADAAGSADKEVENALDSWQVKLNQLKNTFTQFVQNILDTDEIKGFIDAIRFLIQSLDEPEEYAEKFEQALSAAFESLVKKLPHFQDAINRFAITVVKGFISALKDELPTILKELADGARRVTDDLAKNLPDILSGFISAIVEIVVASIADSSLAFDLASSIIAGIIESIPSILINSNDALIRAIKDGISGKDKGAIFKEILGLLGLGAWTVPFDVIAKISRTEGVDEAKSSVDDFVESERNALDAEHEAIKGTKKQAASVKSLSDELKVATQSLDKYKKALEGGEKGDALKSYSEAYKKAVEMYEKGLTGSNQYMSAIDLLFGNVDDYEAAGKLLGNAFVKAMFEGGGDDYGANAANYIRKHLDEFEGVAITEGENGTFGLNVTDMEKFAESTGLTVDALWTLIDALDIFHSKTTYTRDQLFNFMGLEDNGTGGIVNLTNVINDLAGQGKTAREIKEIVNAIKELAEADGNIEISEPKDIDQTIKDITELNQEALKDKDMEVVLTSNSDEFFDGIYKQIEQLDGTEIFIGLKPYVDYSGLGNRTSSSGGRHGGSGGKFSQITGGYGGTIIQTMFPYASGTKSARGGLSLVNEEGAELIYANGKAWIAGGGNPTITNIPIGAGIFNAKETREILSRSGIASNDGAYVGGISENSGGSGKAGKGKLTESLLEQIAEYINDILKKAKEALQEQLDAIDEQIDKLKREHDAEEDANKLEELRLKILEAEKKLAEAENERTVRYFNKETGQWEWMADQKAVADAQKALKDAQEAYDKEVAEQAYQAQLQALQDQKDSLNEAYEQLSDNWDKIYEELQDILNGKGAVDIGKLIQQLLGTKGGGYAPDIQALLEAIGAFTANPTSVLDAATTARIMSLNGTGGATSVLSAVLGSGSYDLNGRGQSTLGGNTSIVGDTIYYINGVQIGSDMMDKPLSQILSVLPIYAN